MNGMRVRSRRFWKILNTLLYVVAFVIVAVITTIVIANKPLPEGREGQEAEALADSMLAAVNLPAWESLRYVRWSFRGAHHYIWDKWYNLADIRFGNTRVLLSLDALQGRAWHHDEQLTGEEKHKMLTEAWQLWCNDSFWFNPVVKIKDPGTERKCVDMDNGEKALLVTFTEGGITPGDSYLWRLDENYLPVAWHMWASILPVKGLKATFEDWINADGALLAQSHCIGPFNVGISNVRTGDHHSELGLTYDPFTDF